MDGRIGGVRWGAQEEHEVDDLGVLWVLELDVENDTSDSECC